MEVYVLKELDEIRGIYKTLDGAKEDVIAEMYLCCDAKRSSVSFKGDDSYGYVVCIDGEERPWFIESFELYE